MKRKVTFAPRAWEEFLFFSGNDRKLTQRIMALIKEIQSTPFDGKGKPEPLRENLAGFWSRRIDDTNRLVYRVSEDEIEIVQMRYHYGK